MTDNIVAIMNQRIEDRDAQQNPLACNIKEAAISLKFATLALRSCYSRNDSSIQEFRELRSGVTNAASVYKKQVLPVAKMSLQKVREFMENFSLLNYEQCVEIADEIAEDAGKCEDLMRLNFDTHEAMAAEFKRFDVDVERVIAKCALEKRRYDEQAKELAASADQKRLWALGLAFVPFAGPFVSQVLTDKSHQDQMRAVAANEESMLAVTAAEVVKETLQRALKEYCFAMDRCAGEFSKLVSDCESFKASADRFNAGHKRSFHVKMAALSTGVLDAVKDFQMITASAESDLAALPPPSRPNYVQEWLANNSADQGLSFMDRLRQIGPEVMKALPS